MGFFITDKIKRWPDGYIPYTISNTDFPVGSNNRKIIENAISHWNDMSNVSLVPLNGESDYCVFQLAPLSGVSCQSSVGRIGGQQSISCALGGSFVIGNVIHEIGHAFGLLHEHQRPDRNDFVIVDPSVINDKDYKIRDDGTIYGPYDCCSIMHYPVTSGKILEKDTMCEGMGQRLHLSEGDLETIKFMYSKSRPCNLPELINGNHSGYLVQSIFGTKGNFELVVPQGNKLKHYYRDNDQPNYPWSLTASQPKSGGVGFVQSNPTSVTLIQSNFKGDGYTGNLEMIVRMTPVLDPEGNGDWLAHYFLDSKTRKWEGSFFLVANGNPITGVTGN